MKNKELIIILGPTCVGKTDYAISKAMECGSPVVSCDSRQIFREMKIGTAAPSPEQLAAVRHYFIFSNSVLDDYTAGRYEVEAMALLEKLFLTHDVVVMAGGSGLYIDALCKGLDDFPPADMELRDSLMNRLKTEGLDSLRFDLRKIDRESYDTIDIANPQRVVRALEVTLQTGKKFSEWKSSPDKKRFFKITKVGLNRNRAVLYDRINLRTEMMIGQGLVEEAESLLQYRDRPALRTVGYREIFRYLDGEISLEEAVSLIKRNTRHYAKRQLTYWARDREIVWKNL
ncbi:MAG: tRNA (adenosine(37)-N6)-dimethylallyltransferase MiaA [Bacteroidales bacterium]|jgi:tRNA dimethylallyltransferase|nr:tRNA (adenosine(37)-N6)-dimethylallyltransferase MiaA [Bacteroidales bacterium]